MKKVFFALSILVAIFSVIRVSAAKEKCLVMGLIPAENPKAMIEQYKPMVKWMEKDMGRCIKVSTATDYSGVIEAMRAKKLDFAWFGPFSYVLANQRAGAEAFAVGIMQNGRTTYRSYLVATPEVAKKLGISSPLEGEKGMKILAEKLKKHRKEFTFTFTDPASTSGFAVPRYFMYKAGIDPDKVFKRVGFIGTHDASELVVRNKIIDIGADNDMTYPRLVEAGKISPHTNVVIWRSPPLPGSPLAYREDLPEDDKAALRKAIVSIPKDAIGNAGFGKLIGFRLVTDEDYKLIKDIKKVIDTLR